MRDSTTDPPCGRFKSKLISMELGTKKVCFIILMYCETKATCRRKRKLSLKPDLRGAAKSWGSKFFNYSLAITSQFSVVNIIF